TADSESVSIAASDHDVHVVIGKLDTRRDRERPAMQGVHAVRVDEAREVRGTSDAANGYDVVGLDLEFDERLLERRQYTKIAATGAPVGIDPSFEVMKCEFSGVGLYDCGHISSSDHDLVDGHGKLRFACQLFFNGFDDVMRHEGLAVVLADVPVG